MRQVKRQPIEVVTANPERLKYRVNTLVTNYFPRNITNPTNLRLAADWIGKEMQTAGAKVETQPFKYRLWGGFREGKQESAESTYRNVIGSYGPPTKDIVVVGAHYDAHDELPGADDNASGCAGVMELADLLAGVELKRRVELVCYALEEAPAFAYASSIHAQSLKAAGKRVIGMLSLEMIGYFRDEEGSQTFPKMLRKPMFPSIGGFISVAGNLESRSLIENVSQSMKRVSVLPVEAICVSERKVPMIGLSDNSSYWEEGFPACIITDTSFFRNPFYHSAGDTPDTLDYLKMSEVVTGVHQAVIDLAS